MKTVAIIQARMSSTRLPGKIMADLAGQPLLSRVIARAQRARLVDLVGIATTDRPADEQVAHLCGRIGVPCFRGSEDDVLDRYYQAAQQFGGETLVRLTADCPLLDPAVIDKAIAHFHSGDFDYVSNGVERTYPDGLDTEVFRRTALEWAWREARLTSEREHVTPYLYKHPELFRLGSVKNDVDLSAHRWTVDEPRDLELVRAIYGHFGDSIDFGMAEILDLLHQHPELNQINAGIECNEGYQKSLQADSIVDQGKTP
jgi:spore coat polysaccharide biosynthesis protein SpsF